MATDALATIPFADERRGRWLSANPDKAWGERFFLLYSPFDSVLLGSGKQAVPIIMYLHAHYFFVTYYTTAVVVMRRFRTSRLNVHPAVGALVVAAAAWFWARAEIALTTAPSLADQFRYEDLSWALRWGR